MTTRRLRKWPDWCKDKEMLTWAIDYVLEFPELLNAWDADFLETVSQYRTPLSDKQFDVFFGMIARRMDYEKEQAPKRATLRIVGGTDYQNTALPSATA
jgi:hypothetical protein